MNITEGLKARADAAFAQYPQYKGYHDDWTAMRTRRRIKTKGGIRAEKGEVVLAGPINHTLFSAPSSRTFVSRDFGYGWSHVCVPASYLEAIEERRNG